LYINIYISFNTIFKLTRTLLKLQNYL